MVRARALMTPGLFGLLAGLWGCGPTLVHFDPSNAAEIVVRPASGHNEFCPGKSFQVELIARLKNGTSCSSTDRSLGCQGEEDAVMSPKMVRLEASAGRREGEMEKFLWAPPEDLLETAGTGILLRGWLETGVEGKLQKSVVGEAQLKPVYECRMDGYFGAGSAGAGQPGAPGPEVAVAITTLATPFYPDAALIRVDVAGSRFYYISPSPDQPVRITSRGQDGGAGARGAAGVKGDNGRSGSSQCENGENGRDGTDGGPGSPGGDGGPGGLIHITVDKAAADRLRSQVLAVSIGGAAGPGGDGGEGGPGGSGGSAGPSGPSCTGNRGTDGRQGRHGQAGASGRPGPSGPPPLITTAARASLFAEELEAITRVEGAARKGGR